MISRRVSILVAAAALAAYSGPAVAQQRSAECRGLRTNSHFMLNSAKLSLDLAVRTQRSDPQRFQTALRDAERQLTQAAGDPMTKAFLTGEMYLLRGDLVGADTNFTAAERTADDECKHEIVRMRRNEWVPLVNGARNQAGANNLDSAVVLLRKAALIFRDAPIGYLQMAGIFDRRGQTDSAIAYYRLAAQAGNDPRDREARIGSYFAAASLLMRRERWAEAETVFRSYREQAPADLAGIAGLAAALSAQNRTAQANALYDTLAAVADTSANWEVLFDVGTQMVHARRYPVAARLYERALTINRCDRDGLYNLASTYNTIQDSVRMLPIARRLAEVDPMNRGALAMLAQAYVLKRDTASIGVLQRLQEMPWAFDLVEFDRGDSTATVLGGVSNLGERPVAAFRLTFEFVNAACQPVSQTVVEVPEIAPNGSQSVNITGRGRGITAYRYRAN